MVFNSHKAVGLVFIVKSSYTFVCSKEGWEKLCTIKETDPINLTIYCAKQAKLFIKLQSVCVINTHVWVCSYFSCSSKAGDIKWIKLIISKWHLIQHEYNNL